MRDLRIWDAAVNSGGSGRTKEQGLRCTEDRAREYSFLCRGHCSALNVESIAITVRLLSDFAVTEKQTSFPAQSVRWSPVPTGSTD